MKSPRTTHSVADAGISMRFASISEIDALNDIDLDASVLFERAGLHMDFADDHEFAIAERQRWNAAVNAGTTLVAVDARDERIGFAAVGVLDGEPYLAQLSVRASCMRRGVGSALVGAAAGMLSQAGARVLWLTTYGHLPWNRSFYERRGFEMIPADGWGPEMNRQLLLERRWLPRPDERVVMRKAIGA
ncbi:MAG: GNAT family N-acetyltransferase [Gammaproteobacteria bacterium]